MIFPSSAFNCYVDCGWVSGANGHKSEEGSDGKRGSLSL
jgi:hypothetical protein